MRFKRLILSVLAVMMSSLSYAATFTVSNTNDAGGGSLRQAIINANATVGTDNINFNIPGASPFTIALLSALPAITEAVIINGTTQPGWSAGNPVVQLSGTTAGVGVNGFVVALGAGSCTIRGISIINFSGNGIYSENAAGNTIRGNLIGIAANGAAAGNGGNGIYIAAGCNNNIIGGPANADRNIISSNLNGIDINNSSNNRVENNYIGTGKTGNAARGNRNHGLILGNNSNDNQVLNNVISANGTVLVPSPASAYDADGNGLNIDMNSLRNTVRGNKIGLGADGTTLLGNKENGIIVVNGSNNNVIGGNGAGYRNYIAGSGNHAIVIYQSNNTDVKNNYIGTDVSSTLNRGNNDSGIIIISSSGTLVGGPNVGDDNLFAFSREEQGIRIEQSDNTIVQRNLIGTNPAGTANMGNFGGGILIVGDAGGSTGNIIGSSTAGRGNKIAYNAANGITMINANSYDNAIRRNSIYCNTLRGIELSGTSNEYTTFPAPTILPTSTNTLIRGTARAGAIIEVYGTGAECATCSGNPGSKTVQGKNYLGTVTADGSGNWSFPYSGNPDTITATASEVFSTGTIHSTSEFSACILCVAPIPNIAGPSYICSNSTNVKFYISTFDAASTYTWSVTGASSYTTNNDTVYVNVGASGTVNVQVTEYNSGCSGTDNTSASIRPTPSVSVSASSASICSGSSSTLTANPSGGNGIYTYQWRNTSGNISGANGIEYTTSTSGTYYVTVTSNGCSATSSGTTITVNSTPAVTVSNTGINLCSGTSTTLTANATGGNGSYTYEWFRNGSLIAGQNSSPYTASTAGSYTVRVTSNGCPVTSSATVVSVKNAITVSVNSTVNTICSGSSTTLIASASGGNGTFTYQWSNGSGPITGQTNSTFIATATDTYHVTVLSDGCSVISSGTSITVNSIPGVIVSNTGTNLCSGSSTTLTANATGGNGSYSYEWFNNNSLIAGENFSTYTTSTAGSYTVRVTSNACPVTSSATVVSVKNAISVDVNSTANTICSGSPATLTANASGGNGTFTYQWSNGSGQIAGETNSTYTATTPGTYTVTVTSDGCPVTSSGTNINVNSTPAVTVSNTGTNICSSASSTITANTTGGNGFYTYEWYRNGSLIAGVNSKTYSASTPGAYTVRVTSNGCPVTSGTTVVNVKNAISLNVTNTGTAICSGSETTFTANASGGNGSFTYQWNNGSGPIAGETNNTYTAKTAGSYTVTVTSDGCPVTSSGTAINENSTPTPVISGSTDLCANNNNVVLSTSVDNSGSGSVYTWNATGGISIVSNSANQVTVNTGNTGGTLTVIETRLGCSGTDEATINIKQSHFSMNGPVAFCAGDSAIYEIFAVNPFNYSWSKYPADAALDIQSSASSLMISGQSAGDYQVILTVTSNDASACSATDTLVFKINEPASVDISASNDTVCTGTEIMLTANTSNGTGYVWSALDETMTHTHFTQSTSENKFITNTLSGTIIYQVTAVDNNGCTIMDTAKVFSISNQDLVIPNLITPNDDEMNDVLIIKDVNNSDILPGASLEIYNRWGHRVYTNNNYQNNWGGQEQSDGMYYFLLQPSCGEKEYKGWIQILGNIHNDNNQVLNR